MLVDWLWVATKPPPHRWLSTWITTWPIWVIVWLFYVPKTLSVSTSYHLMHCLHFLSISCSPQKIATSKSFNIAIQFGNNRLHHSTSIDQLGKSTFHALIYKFEFNNICLINGIRLKVNSYMLDIADLPWVLIQSCTFQWLCMNKVVYCAGVWDGFLANRNSVVIAINRTVTPHNTTWWPVFRSIKN